MHIIQDREGHKVDFVFKYDNARKVITVYYPKCIVIKDVHLDVISTDYITTTTGLITLRTSYDYGKFQTLNDISKYEYVVTLVSFIKSQ